MFGSCTEEAFKKLEASLTPLNVARWFTDDGGAYERKLEPGSHEADKCNTQKTECINLNFRMWIKRLTRRTICFSKRELIHDTLIALLINKVEFWLDIHAKSQV